MLNLIKDEILLLLGIKPKGKLVELTHILEKVSRDTNTSKSEIMKVLDELIKQGLVSQRDNKYYITEEGRKLAWNLRYREDLNRSYRYVLLARFYYPNIAELILPFLMDRPVSVVKVFSDEKDPIHLIRPIFSRYAKMKPRKIYHFINSRRDLLRYVDMHAIDFIPYVHKLNKNYPDWLIIDIDAGDKIKNAGELGFSYIKRITSVIYYVMIDRLELKPVLKFSGSRGFQIWVAFDKPIGTFEDYRNAVIKIRDIVEDQLAEMKDELKEEFESLVKYPITTAMVAKREIRKDQILLDWSSMKKEGDVRAPYSMHYKTGLVSVPVGINSLSNFRLDDAKVEKVVKDKEKIKNYFVLEPSPSEKIIRLVKGNTLLTFF